MLTHLSYRPSFFSLAIRVQNFPYPLYDNDYLISKIRLNRYRLILIIKSYCKNEKNSYFHPFYRMTPDAKISRRVQILDRQRKLRELKQVF